MNQLSCVGIHIHSDKVRIIDAECINCNKRFKSVRAVTSEQESDNAFVRDKYSIY